MGRLLASLLLLLALAAKGWCEQCLIGSPDGETIMAMPLQAAPRLAEAPYSLPASFAPLRDPDWAWVDATMSTMTLAEKIGQMIMPSYTDLVSAEATLTSYGVCGFIFIGNSNWSSSILNATNSLQSQTTVPLIFSIDCEPGLGGRVLDATRMPMNMAMGAARTPTLAYQQGALTARECRAIGVQIGFGPCLDVNTEPINPIIGIRSYSDDPVLVANLARQHVLGAASQGMLCTFKHYPGHGATTGDSHSSLQVVNITRTDLENRHILPYATLIGEGLGDLVMSAHVWYPCLDPGTTPWPATLSTVALTDILRTQLAFSKVVISDSYDMAGLRLAASSEADAVRLGVLAGLDIVLIPTSVEVARNSLLDAYTSGQLTMARIDQSVRRILGMKSRAGMPEVTTVSDSVRVATVGHPDHAAVARQVAAQSISSAKVVEPPLTSSDRVHCLFLQSSTRIFYSTYDPAPFADALYAALPAMTSETVSTSISSTESAAIVAAAAGYDRTIVVSYNWKPQQALEQVALVQELLAAGRRVVYVSFGSPYHAMEFPAVQNYYCAYCSLFSAQEEMARVLTGQLAVRGIWPVTIPGFTSGVKDALEY